MVIDKKIQFVKLLLSKYMLNITKQSDYAMLFVSYLIGKKDRYVPLSKLIKETNMPQRFLARIAAELVKKGVVESKEGKVGGYKLSQKAQDTSLYDFLKIFEGELSFVKCSKPDYKCPWEYMCKHKSFLRHTLHELVAHELKKWKLRDMFYNKI